MSKKQTGAKYDSNRDTAEIAKLVRKDLKAAFGKAWKFSVRTRRYAGGSSIDVEIKKAPICLYALRPANDGAPSNANPIVYSKAGQLAIDTAQGLLDAYNRQDIDSQSDYFNVHFYGFVNVEGDLRRRQREALGALTW